MAQGLYFRISDDMLKTLVKSQDDAHMACAGFIMKQAIEDYVSLVQFEDVYKKAIERMSQKFAEIVKTKRSLLTDEQKAERTKVRGQIKNDKFLLQESLLILADAEYFIFKKEEFTVDVGDKKMVVTYSPDTWIELSKKMLARFNAEREGKFPMQERVLRYITKEEAESLIKTVY